MSGLETLLASLAGVPALPGARCCGRHHLFDAGRQGEDPDVVNARHDQALQLCGQCPAQMRCQDWLESLPTSQRPVGVVAGQLIRPKVPGRPRRSV